MFRQTRQLAVRQFSRSAATICDSPWFRLVIAVMLTCLLLPVPRARAITISFSYDERARPSFDPDGTELKRIAAHAAALWSSYILDDRSFHFDLSWGNLDGGRLGQHEDFLGFATNNIIIDTRDVNGVDRNWFFDPTPFSNEEFNGMNQTLVRDMNPTDVEDGFSGSPPAVLETGFNGFTSPGSPAHGKIDLFSIVLHEMGHELGMNYTFNESVYDFNSNTVGGQSLGVVEGSGYEIALDTVLMTDWPNLSTATAERRLPSATDILATFNESVTAVPDGHGGWQVIYFDNYNLPRVDFIGAASNSWHETLNWIGGAVPDYDNEAFIRHGGMVIQSDGTSTAKALTISDASSLTVRGQKLYVFGDTNVGKNGTRGDLNIGNFDGSFSNFQTDKLFLNNGVVNIFNSTGSLDVNREMAIASNGILMGAGTVRVSGNLINNGQINGGTFLLFGFGGTLTLATSGVGARLDLDGNGSESGEISATIGNLAVYGPLADDFNGRAGIAETRTMSFSQPWKMMGNLSLNGGADASHLATLAGAQVTIGSQVDVNGQSLISAPVILNNPAVVNLPDANDTLILAGPSTLRGGNITGNGTLAIQGATSVAMPNSLVPEDFPTEISPLFFVVADTDLTLELDPNIEPSSTSVFIGGFTTYALNVPLQVRTGGVMTASVSNLYLPRQTTMSGGQITGLSTVNQVGSLVVDGNSTINPNTYLWGVDTLTHNTTIRAGKRLDLTPNRIVRTDGTQEYRGNIVLETGATLNVNTGIADSWTMAGDLAMGIGSTVTGDNLVNTGQVHGNGFVNVARFENAGRVTPGRMFGGLQMTNTNFVQTPAGVLDIVLGSSFIGNGSGILRTGTAQLAGTLALSLSGGFNPAPGTEFDLLTASSISGQFGNVQINVPFGSSLLGDVLYYPNRVTFRVDLLNPAPRLTADFNADGKVDGTDLIAWQQAYGEGAIKRGATAGDADGDSDIDGRDFLAWQRQITPVGKGTISSRTLFTAVPEPSTMLLGLLAVAGTACSRRSVK